MDSYLEELNSHASIAARQIKELPEAFLKKGEENGRVPLIWEGLNTVPKRHAVGANSARAASLPEPGRKLPEAPPSRLGQEIARLNQRVEKGGLPFAVEPALVDKPLTVAGMERADAGRAASALAAVYGLRVRTQKDARVISRRAFTSPITLFNVREAIAATLPAPVLRILTGTVQDKALSETEKMFTGSTRQTIQVRLFVDEAVRQLRLSQERTIDQAGDKGAPVAALNASDQGALAFAEMGNFLETVARRLNSEPPRTITQFEALHVAVKRHANEKGEPRLQLALSLYAPNQQSLRPIYIIGNVREAAAPATPRR